MIGFKTLIRVRNPNIKLGFSHVFFIWVVGGGNVQFRVRIASWGFKMLCLLRNTDTMDTLYPFPTEAGIGEFLLKTQKK